MAPDRIGSYEVLRLLGRGGMGSVYLALDEHGRTVAVKVIHPHLAEDASGLKRLAREADAMRKVSSPNVAEIMDADLLAATPYIVTRYVQGRALQQVVEGGGPLDHDTLLRLGQGLASALDAVHRAGVVHRDLTPRNVMMADGVPVVIDLGIAQAFEQTRMTQGFVGTPGYIAPEVIRGERAGPAADVFAWAATMVFAATGRACFTGRTTAESLHRVLNEHPDLSGVPHDLLPRVSAALSKDPADRPSISDLLGRKERVSSPWAPPDRAEPQQDQLVDGHREAFRAALARGDGPAAAAIAGALLDAALRAADRDGEAWALRALGESLAGQGRHAEATGYFETARRVAVDAGRRDVEAASLYGLGVGAARQGDPARAHALMERAQWIAADIGNADIEELTLDHLARWAEERGDHHRAGWWFERFRQVAAAAADRPSELLSLCGVGRAAVHQGNHELALRCLDAARRLATDLGTPGDPQVGELAHLTRKLRRRR